MKISYSWLKEYIKLEETPEEISAILTQIGLESGAPEKFDTVKGGMEGLVVGKVITCEQHPNADKLSKTTVDIGQGELLNIVCGAPNVAAGQKVVVAPVGTTLYFGNEEVVMKKAKIRGEISEGMICAEDEIGIGTNHEGTIVLDDSAEVGTDAKRYFNVESDWIIEIDLTPNRIDSSSHIGVARDLAAYLGQKRAIEYTRPSVDHFKVDNLNLVIPVEVENTSACPRYTGLTISGVEVKESPDWLKNRLRAIGHSPINNVVDVTNYVLFETGQPLHAFDAAAVTGGKVVVKTMPAGTKFTTLDQVERGLHEEDLMICNTQTGMCIGGVFGGLTSGVTEKTNNVFLESAYFDPVFIRKTARRHGLSTDASFRFERGVDPNNVLYALKRAAMLIKEVAGGTISSDIMDVYPEPIADFPVRVTWSNINRLIGKELGSETIKNILSSLEIKIDSEDDSGLSLLVPPYRVDVKREADVIEEILRIYGYNNVEIPTLVKASLQTSEKPDPDKVRNLVSEMLTSAGFHEIWSNSLTKSSYYENLQGFDAEKTVKLLNPLSNDLGGMRQSLLFGGLECIAWNSNRQNRDLKLYEFGNCYHYKGTQLKDHPESNYYEEEHLALFVTGSKNSGNWAMAQQPSTFYHLKAHAENILRKLGLSDNFRIEAIENGIFQEGIAYIYNNRVIMELGVISKGLLQKFDIENPVYFADFKWNQVFTEARRHKVVFEELPKYPAVRRDLALLLDKGVQFRSVQELAFKTERQLLRRVDLFDVYQGKGIPEDKKSYAVSFILRDDQRTMKDKQIDKTMQRLLEAFKKELGAELR